MASDADLVEAAKRWGAALNACDLAHARGDEAARVAAVAEATAVHARLATLATAAATATAPAVTPGWVQHPVDGVLTPQWFVDLYQKHREDPRRVPGCPGCDTFGLCVWHSVPPENRPRKGHPRALGETPE